MLNINFDKLFSRLNDIIQGYENGRLKMIDFKKNLIALKSIWIRLLIFSNSKWTNLYKASFGYNMQTLMKFGIDVTNMTIKKFKQ